ncbi:MerR family transcriptional regulator [Anaerocolumna xylanovorans]|uniref:DUF1836 domain-containing protein n=1 Tax=Anaerocolumna xylanovorans DSM 12503 TaxID=1121345 RepID=A0A1M7Y161_9FIRM|nr:DUF1836 domain-containing protein [Anaerocolumna xylanovorans]SHO45476.1 hypothetical protein SAMN02745217_00968 [Anaerocolumna xylanovorans DSM 12503]
MSKERAAELRNIEKDNYELIIKEVVTGISKNVQNKYNTINLQKIPDHVSYSKVEKYLRSIGVEITRKMFFTYLAENLIPAEQEVKNSRYSYYTKEQILYYILIDMFKPILPLSKIKVLFDDLLKPMIAERGLESTFKTLCGLITYMVEQFSETATSVIGNKELGATDIALKTLGNIGDGDPKALSYVAQYTNLVTLCMAKGALDFYKHSPNTLLE